MRLSVLALALLATPAAAEAPTLTLSLARAEEAARAHAWEAKAASAEAASAREGAGAALAPLLPRLTFDANYRWQSEVPSLALAPGQPARPFGDHRSDAYGPTLTWTLWDSGALWKSWKAQTENARSREESERLAGLLAVQGARLAYAQAQLAREKVRLLADSVALADARWADVRKRLDAGAASRIDLLSAHQEDLSRRKEFFAAQADLAAALRALFQLTGLGEGLDATRPVDARVSTAAPAGLPEPTLRVVFDSLGDTPPALAAAEAGTGPSASHPAVAGWARQAEGARLSASAAKAGRWPKVTVSGSIQRQYPNGPVLEDVTQKTVAAAASVPLFDYGLESRQAAAQAKLAEAAEARRALAAEQLARDWDKAKSALAALRSQEALDAAAVSESEELARLVYLSYQAGRSHYLDVQTYDLAALQAKVAAAQTRAQILVQLAALAELAAQG